MDLYERLAPYIQDYIYRSGWTQFREIQVAACELIFGTDAHIVLSSGTASGKTEAAFLPALTLLDENPSSSVGILYISPLKALINDQFVRIGRLLEESDIPVCMQVLVFCELCQLLLQVLVFCHRFHLTS